MSESTSTPRAPSSSPHATSRTPNTSFAFLVHSPDTVANALPPDVDNKPLARQKRRRTRYVVFHQFAFLSFFLKKFFWSDDVCSCSCCCCCSIATRWWAVLGTARDWLHRPHPARFNRPAFVHGSLPTHRQDTTSLHHTALTTSHSKEDEEILKAEYLKNAKPDKAARIEIVSKVALGEKEVQVRFSCWEPWWQSLPRFSCSARSQLSE